jgi:hypothetical protein
MAAADPDLPLRQAAVARARQLIRDYDDVVPLDRLREGFTFEGERVSFGSSQRGIHRAPAARRDRWSDAPDGPPGVPRRGDRTPGERRTGQTGRGWKPGSSGSRAPRRERYAATESARARRSWSGTQERQGDDGDAVLAPVCRRAGGDDDLVEHAVTELLLQPGQVLGIVAGDAARELDFDGDDAAVGALDDEVDLLASARGTEMPDLRLAMRSVDGATSVAPAPPLPARMTRYLERFDDDWPASSSTKSSPSRARGGYRGMRSRGVTSALQFRSVAARAGQSAQPIAGS